MQFQHDYEHACELCTYTATIYSQILKPLNFLAQTLFIRRQPPRIVVKSSSEHGDLKFIYYAVVKQWLPHNNIGYTQLQIN